MNSVLDVLFGCSHEHTTFPLTPKHSSTRQGMYVTCLDCGKEFSYNWKEMRIEYPEQPVSVPATRIDPVLRPVQEKLSRLLRLGNRLAN